jgi:transposase
MTSPAQRRDRAAAAAELRAADWSLRQIARHLRVAESTVRADLRAAAAPLRPSALRRPWQGNWRPEALRLRAKGHPDHQGSQPRPYWMIAKDLAVDERDIRRYFARLGKRDARAAEAAVLHASGLSGREIARRLGVSEATIRRDLTGPRGVRHPRARKTPPTPLPTARTADLRDAPGIVIPLRRNRHPGRQNPEPAA